MAAVGLVFLLAIPSTLAAQDAPARPALIVLRPGPGVERLLRPVARMLSWRTGATVILGEPAPEVLEAVPAGHVGLGREDGTLRVVYGGPHGRAFSTEVDLPGEAADESARTVALAIESLLDSAATTPEELPPEWAGPGAWRVVESVRTIREREVRRRRSEEAIAKPTIFLRMLFGVSPVRGTFLVGPGAGLGLCVNAYCVVIEGDLPLVPEERRARDGARVTYRPVNVSTRVQLRPVQFGDFSPGFTIGFMTRIGNASIENTAENRIATNLGIRSTLELGWRFVPRFEGVIEAGLDMALSRARFIRSGEELFLEDTWTPWFVVSLRLRP
jgi:hypothetical protein